MAQMIRDQFKKWLGDRGEATWQEAKAFYDSVASGDPKWTGTAVNRLLAEFGRPGDLPGHFVSKKRKVQAAPSAPAPETTAFEAGDLQVVFGPEPNQPKHRLVLKEPGKTTFRASNAEVQGWIRDIVARFEADPQGTRTVDIRVQGASMVVVHKLNVLGKRQYRVWVNSIQQEGSLNI